MNNVLQPDASVLPLPSETSPDTCCFNLSPCNMAAAAGDCTLFFFFFLLPQNQTDGNASAVTVAATTCLCKATARCFTLGPFF